MKHSRLVRIFSLVLAAQFLNVQIQTAFATPAITGSNPEVQAILAKATEKLSQKLEGKSEHAIYQFAYRLFSKDIKGRNRLFGKTNEEFQSSLQAIENPRESSLIEDPELLADYQEEASNLDVLAPTTSVPKLSSREIKREQIIQNADALLLSLGATVGNDGKLSAIDFNSFSQKLNEMRTIYDTRAPASAELGIILKVILALLVISVGLFGILLMIAIIAFGGTSILIYIVIAGILVGGFFALKGIFSHQKKRLHSIQFV